MTFSATGKLSHAPSVVAAFTNQFGFPLGLLRPIGLIELGCVAIYLVPRTAVLGAVLIAAFFGGATVSHLRIGDPTGVAPPILGILAWVGLWLREPRLRALLPLRKG
jgi:hypothetical protein